MTAQEWLTVGLIVFGTFFKIVAAVGLNRLPDFYSRMHLSTKATTLGVTFILLAVAVHFGTAAAITKMILVILFFFITAPVGAHMLARASYLRGVKLWHGTVLDDLATRYDSEKYKIN